MFSDFPERCRLSRSAALGPGVSLNSPFSLGPGEIEIDERLYMGLRDARKGLDKGRGDFCSGMKREAWKSANLLARHKS